MLVIAVGLATGEEAVAAIFERPELEDGDEVTSASQLTSTEVRSYGLRPQEVRKCGRRAFNAAINRWTLERRQPNSDGHCGFGPASSLRHRAFVKPLSTRQHCSASGKKLHAQCSYRCVYPVHDSTLTRPPWGQDRPKAVNRLANLTPHRRPILTPLRGELCW